MKTSLKTNLKKFATLMLAVMGLATVLGLMPEHSSAYHTAQAPADGQKVIAQN